MSDLQEQLDILRRRVSQIDPRPSAARSKRSPHPERPMEPFAFSHPVEDALSGQEVVNSAGAHFQMERVWECHQRHGSVEISALCDLPEDLLDALSNGSAPQTHPSRWAFLDTETTGLAGGSGTYAFLVGVGRITAQGFHLRQFFMRDLGEEASLLQALAEYLREFDTLVTYNGKAYDQPLLETRFRMSRTRPPFASLEHVDLLFGARRLWKLRFESCRLVELERQVLGVEREGDIPGDMIPYVYFDYIRSRHAYRVVPILHHNALDIVTLACLTAVIPWVFRSPEDAPLTHGVEMIGVARWLCQGNQPEKALVLYRRALKRSLPDALAFRTLWDIAQIERKLNRFDAALACYCELTTVKNAHRVQALEELAKYYEHKEKDVPMALEYTLQALMYEPSEPLFRRRLRLEKRMGRRAAQAGFGA